jgi:hypothetical protein
MIRWSDIEPRDEEPSDAEKRWWRRNMCECADWRGGLCGGYANGDDDEPCEICKACDRLGIEVSA